MGSSSSSKIVDGRADNRNTVYSYRSVTVSRTNNRDYNLDGFNDCIPLQGPSHTTPSNVRNGPNYTYSSPPPLRYSTPETPQLFSPNSTISFPNSYTNTPVRTTTNSFATPSTSVTTRTVPSFDQIENDDIARAIRMSLRENYSSPRPSTSTTMSLSASSSQYRSRSSNIEKKKGDKVSENKMPANTNASTKGEMTLDCSICMDFKGDDEIVATKCGHIFHRECVSTWIRESGTCPTCRVIISTGSLLKLFVTVNPNAAPTNSNETTASTSKTTASTSNVKMAPNSNAANSNSTSNVTNSNSTSTSIATNARSGNANARYRRRNNNNNNNNTPTMYGRTIWCGCNNSSYSITEQALTFSIMQLFNIGMSKFSIRSLQKPGTNRPNQRYVSFKISVDSESTFNILMNNSKWPHTIRVREFIERN